MSCGARLASLDRRRGKRHAITRSRDLLFNSRVHIVRWGRLRIRQEYLQPWEWKGRRERETWTECQGHPFCGYLCRASFGSTRASHAATAASTGRCGEAGDAFSRTARGACRRGAVAHSDANAWHRVSSVPNGRPATSATSRIPGAAVAAAEPRRRWWR